MKFIAVLLCAAALVWAVDREGNFTIRFEPAVVLQTKVQVPFNISVQDALNKPLTDAQVTLQIERPDHSHVAVYKAPAVGPGMYMAKPVFPFAGQWNIYVEVHRNGQMSARTIQFDVPE